MTEENDAKLVAKYPKLFRDVKQVETDDGWFDLLDTLCNQLQSRANWIIESKKRIEPDMFEDDLQPVVAQIKQKFSSLRAYFDNCDDEMRGMIQMAEAMSYHICEGCGAKATVSTTGWVRRLCLPCSEVKLR